MDQHFVHRQLADWRTTHGLHFGDDAGGDLKVTVA
jgi:hypothetical protein